MKSDQEYDSHHDRREYFRIDDTVRVSARRVPEQDLEACLARLEFGSDSQFTLMSSLMAISAQTAVHMRRIENELPDVAAYLKGLDRKLDVIGKAFIAGAQEQVADEVQGVNISAGGMCLLTREAFRPGDIVELRMLLFPSFTGLLIYGTVVECTPLPDGDRELDLSHRARVEFTHIREQDQEVLIRHILRRQGDFLRERQGGD